jgi:hypothetical protein
MADELKQAWTPTREEVKNNLLNLSLLGGSAYGVRKASQYGFVKLMDTLGQGRLGIEAKYISTPKMTQAWNNYLNVLQPGETPISASFRVGKQLLKGADLEILSAENSIRQVENELKNMKLSDQQRITLENKLRNRKIGLEDRKVAVANKYKVFGYKPPNYPMKHAKHTMTKVTPLMAKVERSLKPFLGKNVMATEMSNQKMQEFKNIALNDKRIQYVSSLLKNGKIKEATKAASGGYYMNKGKLIIPSLSEKGIPLNVRGGNLGGMKLIKLPKAEWLLKSGKPTITYALGFVPTTPFGEKKMEFITGRHYQRMKFIRHGKGYAKAGLDLIDVSNYAWNRPTEFIERRLLGGKPVVNIGEATWNLPKNIQIDTNRSYNQKMKRLMPAYRGVKETAYGKTKKVPVKSIAKKLAEVAGPAFKFIISKGRRF